MTRRVHPILGPEHAVGAGAASPKSVTQLQSVGGAKLCEQPTAVVVEPFARPAGDADILQCLRQHRTAHALAEPDEVRLLRPIGHDPMLQKTNGATEVAPFENCRLP